MQALALKPSFGWSWIGAGWRLFRAQPLAFVALLIFYTMLVLSSSTLVGLAAQAFGSSALVETVGVALVMIVTPALAVGFMQAARDAGGPAGKPANPLVLFAAFKSGRAVVRQLLWVGVVEFVAVTLVLTLTQGSLTGAATTSDAPATKTTVEPRASGTPTAPPATAGEAKPDATELTLQQRDAVFQMVRSFPFYVLVELVLWYAPVLVAWHRLSAAKAIFFSAVAVWRNLGAFVVYGLGWLVIWLGLSVSNLLAASIVGPNVAGVLVVPLALLVLTWMFCSKYATYASVFVDPDDPARTAPVDDPSS